MRLNDDISDVFEEGQVLLVTFPGTVKVMLEDGNVITAKNYNNKPMLLVKKVFLTGTELVWSQIKLIDRYNTFNTQTNSNKLVYFKIVDRVVQISNDVVRVYFNKGLNITEHQLCFWAEFKAVDLDCFEAEAVLPEYFDWDISDRPNETKVVELWITYKIGTSIELKEYMYQFQYTREAVDPIYTDVGDVTLTYNTSGFNNVDSSWSQTDDPACTIYRVQIYADDVNIGYKEIASGSGTTLLDVLDVHLRHGKVITAKVQALNASNEVLSESLNFSNSVTIVAQLPTPVFGSSVVFTDRVTFNWNDLNANADNFAVRTKINAGSWTLWAYKTGKSQLVTGVGLGDYVYCEVYQKNNYNNSATANRYEIIGGEGGAE